MGWPPGPPTTGKAQKAYTMIKIARTKKPAAPQHEVAVQLDVAPQQDVAVQHEVPVAAPQQELKAKASKKISNRVARWKAQVDLPETAVITVLTPASESPKGKGPMVRYALYETGKTVADYITAVKGIGQTKAQAKADVRWDLVSGFIAVEPTPLAS